MIDLDYGDEDVIATLLSLEVEDYSHTLIDRDNDEPPWLFVFGKEIQKKMVYIKYKIREGKRIIICVSFHYPKEEMEFPYK
ncbi:MAG: type II toxin-antitoxin system MqsR family toxin [Clostridiales bacterium]|nr:type II toxin-antitoxin system MqsR family toxin [Clostridiales bacterium]